MQVTDIDRMFALRALKVRIEEAYADAEAACRESLLEEYAASGSRQKVSPYFGEDAGKFSVRRGKPPAEHVDFNLADDVLFAEWIEDNPDAAIAYAKRNAAQLGQWWFEETGELPEGISRISYMDTGKPDSAQVYSFKPDVVLAKLAEGGDMLAAANRLLAGGGV